MLRMGAVACEVLLETVTEGEQSAKTAVHAMCTVWYDTAGCTTRVSWEHWQFVFFF